MADPKKKTSLSTKTSANNVIKRPKTSVIASSSRISQFGKDRGATTAAPNVTRPLQSRPKINKNVTVTGVGDITTVGSDVNFPELSEEHVSLAYSKFLRGIFEECLLDEKIERERTEIDVQISHLAKRFGQTMEQLDQTNKRVNEISFAVEEKRLLDLKKSDTAQYFNIMNEHNIEGPLKDFKSTEQAHNNQLITKNVDFGYNKKNGHQQLLDAVNDAIVGLETIKKHSKLDLQKVKEYEKTQFCIEETEKDMEDFEATHREYQKKFPNLNERIIKEAAEYVSKYIESDGDTSDNDD